MPRLTRRAYEILRVEVEKLAGNDPLVQVQRDVVVGSHFSTYSA
ncbi:hypothetical protein [Microseira wollei]|uniref:Uncharacterized protein n=1 Tax=Microseira wollei NIES-4236 TaxID=2530354 RepID=A0AAV3XKM9_9CYAN|nr:hypothetical protein [Microseira wollei]GET43223.1 hypothetical protein MiSe_80450 [Microseira wollei NIES-4236]